MSAPKLLITQKDEILYLERSKIFCENNTLYYAQAKDGKEFTYNIPHINTSILFLGPGTSLTQKAAQKLAEEKTYVSFTSNNGSTPVFGNINSKINADFFQKFLKIYNHPQQELRIAKKWMILRNEFFLDVGIQILDDFKHNGDEIISGFLENKKSFESKINQSENISEILGIEGIHTKKLYQDIKNCFKNDDFEFNRIYIQTDNKEKNEIVNKSINIGNSMCYGFANATLCALGIPAQFSLIHSKNHSMGLVYDIADLYKNAIVLPNAFSFKYSTEIGKSDFQEKIIKDIKEFEFNDKKMNIFEFIINIILKEID